MKDHDIGFLELVQKSLKSVPEYDVHQVKNKLKNSEEFYLVDVREDSEWIEGNIPNSIHIGKGVIERDITTIIPDKDADGAIDRKSVV